ncbi:lysostaphin resistance A-like protein [uncultured Friedmanniella sp.]|uniref:CPBP family intramembrane glutamic endopeptidase n=1 Tax=uncultured Friedmanniella sp. TaxID=335381 RepID=UPI0035CC3078
MAEVPARRHDLSWFFGLTFGLTWGVAALVLLARPQVEAVTGEFGTSSPLYYLAVYAPSLSAVVLTAVRTGRSGLEELASRLLRRRVSPGWYALVLLAWPFADLLARLLEEIVTERPLGPLLLSGIPPTPLHSWYLAPAMLLATLLLDAGPLGEELGWRGYALPRLVRGRLGRLGSAAVLGLVWGAWHLPAFLISGTFQHDERMGVLWLILGTVLSSLIMTWLYLRTGGNILLAGILVHLMNNSTVSSLWAFDLVMTLPALVAAVALLRRDRSDRADRRARHVAS